MCSCLYAGVHTCVFAGVLFIQFMDDIVIYK